MLALVIIVRYVFLDRDGVLNRKLPEGAYVSNWAQFQWLPGAVEAIARMNRALAAVEPALLLPAGLPHRPWYRHSIYAPGEFTGYEAVVLPGVNEAIDASDAPRAQAQLAALALALKRATAALNTATH